MEPKLKGTLQEKVKVIQGVQNQIQRILRRGHYRTKHLTRLLDQRAELEIDIDRHLLRDERIVDPVLDYCFRHFCAGRSIGGEGEATYGTAFDKLPLLKKFLRKIVESKGQEILTIRGCELERGVITGPGEFTVNDTYRYLHIPVEQLRFSDTKTLRWKTGKTEYDIDKNRRVPYGERVWINPDVIEHRRKPEIDEKGIWETDYSGVAFVGNERPSDTSVYIGDENVQRGMRNRKEKQSGFSGIGKVRHI